MLRAADLPYDDFEAMRAFKGSRARCSDGADILIGGEGDVVVLTDTVRRCRHNPDGPATLSSDGEQAWYLDGLMHREGGPAHIRPDGFQAWWMKGRPHRLDGPAVVFADGRSRFFIDWEMVDADDPRLMLGGEPV